jgi:hypothetical protein
LVLGAEPACDIDHVDMDPSNNAWLNLRPASRAQNSANKRSLPNNTSRLKGAFKYRGKDRWYSSIKSNGDKLFLGSFDTPEEAHTAYCEAAHKHHGEYARLA